ncbi:MAG: FecR domain-containing protein [Betaproteobacteria bacterium]
MAKPFRYWVITFCALVSILSLRDVEAVERVYATVESVQMPAWFVRNGQRQPLAPGKVLQNRDRVITGDDARVLIRLAEGSAVKLGENAQLDLNALGRRENRIFTAALDVAKGAFRFTTGIFSRLHQHRAVNVRIATITAGIRGTDLWGSSDEERDLVCLLEGRISVFHPFAEGLEMSEPMSFYAARKGAAPQAVDKVDAEQMAKWAAETEVQQGSGYANRNGKWKLELATVEGEVAALDLYDRARAAGYEVRIKPRATEAGYSYGIRVTQLPSKAEAEILGAKLIGVLGLDSPLVTRY